MIFMKNKILAVGTALALSAVTLAGCKNIGNIQENKNDKQNYASSEADGEGNGLKAPVSEEKIDIKKGATENMLVRSVLREGDKARLAEKLDNALSDPEKTTTIVYLGDSITAGSSASWENQYTNRFTKWWQENISENINAVNAGIGATDSYLGVHRAERDALSCEPDIIFIEFINDADNEFYKASMDSLVRKCLSCSGNPAVVLIEMTRDNGASAQGVHTEIADVYGLPVISYHDAVIPEIEAGNFKWEEISPDDIHPDDTGHMILAQLLANYFDSVKSQADKIEKSYTTELPDSPTGDVYENAALADRSSKNVTVVDEGSFTQTSVFGKYFSDGWGTTTGGSITFEVEAKNIGLVYNKNISGTYGIAKISVDGVTAKIINADFVNGWGSYSCMEEFYSSDETAVHTVTIEVGDTGKTNFDVYALLIS